MKYSTWLAYNTRGSCELFHYKLTIQEGTVNYFVVKLQYKRELWIIPSYHPSSLPCHNLTLYLSPVIISPFISKTGWCFTKFRGKISRKFRPNFDFVFRENFAKFKENFAKREINISRNFREIRETKIFVATLLQCPPP